MFFSPLYFTILVKSVAGFSDFVFWYQGNSRVSAKLTPKLQIFALIPGDILLSIFFQVLYCVKQLLTDEAEYISMHIHIVKTYCLFP